jgi:hypothetical protein
MGPQFTNIVSQLVTIFSKPICTSPAKGYFVTREKQEAHNYLDSVLTEIGDRPLCPYETESSGERQRSLPTV